MMKWYDILWQLPQWIVGQVYLYLHNDDVIGGFTYNNASYYILRNQSGSVTFCKDFIFLSRWAQHSDYTILHEYGHTVQGRYLGWLYLVVVGLPSLLWAAVHSAFGLKVSYRKFFTEKWADKLGKV